MAFGDVIRSAASPSGYPTGIGGDNATIWYCDHYTDKVYKLDTADFSVIRSAASPSGTSSDNGIGGDNATIWHCDSYTDKVYELDTADFSVIRSAALSLGIPSGIGGDNATIWYCDHYTDKVYELDTADFSVIRSAALPLGTTNGIGGDNATIWRCDSYTDKVYELDTADFSVIRSAASPSGYPTGIGGDNATIWYCDYYADRIYKLDADVNLPPVADCNGLYTGFVDEDITFDGSGSYDPDGTIVSWDWDFGDGNVDSGEIVTHAYTTANTFTVTLTVTDDNSATDVVTCQCVVTMHIISISPVSGYNHVDTNVTIYGSGFIDGCTVMIDGTNLTNVVFVNSFEVTATVPSGLSKGDYDITLTNPDTSNITLTNGFLVKIRTITTAPTNKGSRLRSRTIYNIVN